MERTVCPGSGPLWGRKETWGEANETIAYLFRLNRERLKPAVFHAENIKSGLIQLFTILDRLCESSCPWCPETCCLSAKIWFDFKDLLFLHLTSSYVPPDPVLSDMTQVCRYLGPKGCRLDRISRPWICTWYLCPTQTAILRRPEEPGMNEVDRMIAAIKYGREKMELEFIHAISG